MSIEKLMKLKKAGKNMSPVQKDAKMSVLKDLKSTAEEMMGDKLKGLKKVTVASDSEEGLSDGLEKAKELLGMSEEAEESDEHESEELAENEEESSDDGMSEEDIDAKLAKLMQLKEKKRRA